MLRNYLILSALALVTFVRYITFTHICTRVIVAPIVGPATYVTYVTKVKHCRFVLGPFVRYVTID